ncbi:MAG: hypothetical protein KAR40_03645 [Candidatus Sabulitectum sp.]|nr:hypothetical protein [Candidatus Sabulitectum sp.]
MMMTKEFAAVFLIFAIACTSEQAETGLQTQYESDLRILEVAGVIGVEMGEAEYVFGAIQAIGHNSSGEVAVLDRISANVRFYSRSGEYLRTVSHRGEGPGELINPLAMCLWPDGRISILDPMRGGFFGFTNEGEYLGVELEISRNAHLNTIAVSDSEFVAVKNRLSFEGDTGSITIFIGLFPVATVPSVTYWEKELPFDLMRVGDQFLDYYLYTSWTADQNNGNVYISLFNETDYEILCFNQSGDLLNTITMDLEPVEKTEAEILGEIDYVTAFITALEGGEPQFNVECTPFPYRLPVSELCVDSQGNIWARRGTTDEPFFDIWTAEGDLVGQAVLNGVGRESRSWNFIMDAGGILAYDENPALFQQIFIIE